MPFFIGLDIGGTKTAGGVFGDNGNPVAQSVVPTPGSYEELVAACGKLFSEFEKICGEAAKIGIGIAGMIDQTQGTVFAPNIPYLAGKPFRQDLEKLANHHVHIANDADCAALSEAIDGAGQGHRLVFGLVMGTGVGGGMVIDGKLYQGTHGMAGEIGHVPLPFREASDGPVVACGCGQKGCLDKTISGPALARLYKVMTGKEADAAHVGELAQGGDAEARRVLDQFYTTVAKACTVIFHTFDPEVIVINGGLNDLPGIYDEVPRRWGQYCLAKSPRTKLLPAKFGSMSGLRGAAWLGI
ncbi:MAG: ROK family protein [Bdellovibrionales bacterium]